MQIIFLGTGASGGTPGWGKSKRSESSVFIKNGPNILIDVTRNFSKQAKNLTKIDAILLTHGHMDAYGGVGQLRTWWKKNSAKPISIYAHPKTINLIKRKYKLLDHCRFVPVKETQIIKLSSWDIIPHEVPHSKDPKFPTFAWKLTSLKTIVYASDIAYLTTGFRRFCQGTDILIIDGATWKRTIFTHLRVDKDLFEICKLKVGEVILTQIGKSAPSYEEFAQEVKRICPKATLSFDGMKLKM